MATWIDASVDLLVNSGWPADARMDKVDSTWKGILESLKAVGETSDVSGKQKVTLFFLRPANAS